MDLKAQITNLVKLQKVDSEIYVLRYEKDAQPEGLRVLESTCAQKKQFLANIEKQLLDLQKQRKEKELELVSKEEAIKKLQAQLFQLKTNKEYQAMLKEIDGSCADKSVVEDKILEILDQADRLKIEIGREKYKLQEEEQKFNTQKKDILNRGKEIDDRLAQLSSQRKQLVPEIDSKIFAQYERILASRDGLAIVSVSNNSCQGCNMFVPAQVINLIKMYERIVTCEVCNRILYIEE